MTSIKKFTGRESEYPKDERTGRTLPLSKLLASQDLDRHRAMLGLELEIMSKKLDRFGWDRDRDTPAHDRIVIDWMDALQDFPLSEVQAACRQWLRDSPRKMPNEGDIFSIISEQRRRVAAATRWENRVREAQDDTAQGETDHAPRKTPDSIREEIEAMNRRAAASRKMPT